MSSDNELVKLLVTGDGAYLHGKPVVEPAVAFSPKATWSRLVDARGTVWTRSESA